MAVAEVTSSLGGIELPLEGEEEEENWLWLLVEWVVMVEERGRNNWGRETDVAPFLSYLQRVRESCASLGNLRLSFTHLHDTILSGDMTSR